METRRVVVVVKLIKTGKRTTKEKGEVEKRRR
jgi:hypothetical protein